uniref:ERAP1_C domain-containing protein n=1 Tax=Caenorhabditis japonica TaxID=281687 RepID=A0A8R1EFI1_CAEJA
MQPYLHQINHPLIRYTNNQVTGGATFTQEPFGDTSNLNYSQWNYKWTIPLSSSSLRHENPFPLWIPIGGACPNKNSKDEEEKSNAEILLKNTPKKKAVQWEYTSFHSATYGRIIYDDVGFDRLLKSMKNGNYIDDNVKLQLLADEYYYMKREKNANRPYSYDRFLNLANAIFNSEPFIVSPSYSIFAQAQPALEEIARVYRDTIDAPLISRLYKKMFLNVYNSLLWEDTTSWDTNTFAEVFLPFAVRYDIGDVKNRTMNMFANVKTACGDSLNGTAWCNPYTTNLRKAIYCGAAKYSDLTSDYFYKLFVAYNTEVVTNPYFYQEYMALLEGMSCTQLPATLKTLIRLFSSSTLNQNTLFGFLKYNPVASDVLANYIVANQQVVNSSSLNAYLDSMTYNWDSYSRFVQFENLMETLDLTSEQKAVFQTYLDRVNSQFLVVISQFTVYLTRKT